MCAREGDGGARGRGGRVSVSVRLESGEGFVGIVRAIVLPAHLRGRACVCVWVCVCVCACVCACVCGCGLGLGLAVSTFTVQGLGLGFRI